MKEMKMNAEELKPKCRRYKNHILFRLFSWFYCQLMQCLWSEVFVKMHIALQRIWPLVNWMNVKWRYNVFFKKEKEKQFAQFLPCWIVFKHYPYQRYFRIDHFFHKVDVVTQTDSYSIDYEVSTEHWAHWLI